MPPTTLKRKTDLEYYQTIVDAFVDNARHRAKVRAMLDQCVGLRFGVASIMLGRNFVSLERLADYVTKCQPRAVNMKGPYHQRPYEQGMLCFGKWMEILSQLSGREYMSCRTVDRVA